MVTMAAAGVSFLAVMDVFESVSPRNSRILLGGADIENGIEMLAAIFELVEYWLDQASSKAMGATTNDAYQQLKSGMASGRFMQKFDSISATIEMMPEVTSLSARHLTILNRIREITY